MRAARQMVRPAWQNGCVGSLASPSFVHAVGNGDAGVRPSASDRRVAWWLFACCALVFAMVVVGGVTRLTHSGLSIVEWQPIVGTLPPLSDADWQQAFGKYQLTPEYQQVNKGMTLDEFKGIFWWEYAHRLLGRLIGVAFLVPLLWFVARRRDSSGERVEALRHLRAGRPAGGARLVHGAKRSRRRSARVAVPPDRASRPGARDLRGDAVGRAFARVSRTARRKRRRRGGRDAGRSAFAVARLRDGALRRIGRRHPGRIRLQHVSADERPPRAARDPHARAVVAKLLLEHGDGAVRSSVDRRARRGGRARAVVEAPERVRTSARVRARRGICCSRSSPCRSRSASRRCCSSFRCRSPRCTRRARCWSSRRRSTWRTRCGDRRSSVRACLLAIAVAPMRAAGDHTRFRRCITDESPQ